VAEHNVFLYKLKTDRGSVGGFDFTAGKVVKVVWYDLIPVAVKVYLMASLDDPSPVQITNGPSLGFSPSDHQLTDYYYRFCSDETAFNPGPHLNKFLRVPDAWPYTERVQSLNSLVCSNPGPTCDLEFTGSPVITETSSSTVNDGAVTVTATSSNGSIKYGLTDFNFITEGQATGTFSNLYSGTYTIYAKDSYGCAISTTVTISPTTVYGTRYFCEWTDILLQHDHKVEIEEQGYAGSSEEMEKAASSPATYKENSDGEDRNYVIRASEFRLRVMVQTNFQYVDLYTQDNRKYKFKYYRDEGAGNVLRWVGFVDQYLYSESYKPTPYEMEIVATDGLASLKDLGFYDESANNFLVRDSQLSFISQILKKLGLGINIISGINEYEDSFTSGVTDDPLPQAYMNPMIYYNTSEIDDDGKFESESCAYVLENILKEYNAVICQADAKWVIYRPEETRASFPYREFTAEGVYSANGTIDPIVYLKDKSQSNRIVWKDQSGHLSMIPSYGKFIVRQMLNKKQSLLQSYSFEEWNIVDNEGLQFFAGWNIALTYGSGTTWGHEKTESGRGAMYVKFNTTTVDGVEVNGPGYKEALIYTVVNPIQYKHGDAVKISFDYLLYAQYPPVFPWTLIEFKVKIGDYYLDVSGNWNLQDNGYHEVYATSYNEFNTNEIIVRSPGVTTTETDADIEFYIRINNNGVSTADEDDYGLDYLRAIEVTTDDVGLKRIIYVEDGTISEKGFYELTLSNDAESLPDVVRPDNYADVTNEVVWKLQKSNNGLASIGSVLIDNVIVRYLPDGAETPEFQESIVTTNPNNTKTLEVEILQGDCPTNITNAKNAYDSFLHYSSFGFLTDAWVRDGFNESDFLQRILLKSLIAQSQTPSRRLQGNFLSDIYLKPYSCVVETMDSDRLYMTQALEIDFKDITHTLDLYELKDVEGDGVVTPFNNAFSSAAFGTSFD
jgi:hypothetical protein